LGGGYADGELPGALLGADGSGLALDRRLHLIDDGKLPGGLRTRAFDDQGVCPQAVMLWRNGQVGARLVPHRGQMAKGGQPTGHATGDAVRVSNLTMRAGARSLNAIAIARGGPSIYIEDFQDIDSALDASTGRFNGRVHGRLMEGNKVVGSVRNLRLRGQLSEVLTSVVDVASDTDRIGAVDAPGLVVDGFSVSR
jgi:PmbA protein